MTTDRPSVYLTTPKFGFFPEALPRSLPPLVGERSIRAPFGIDPWLYNAALKPEIPIAFASLYIVTVFALNAYNRRRKNRPWWIARQKVFTAFVVVHNALLTLYSVATFLAMCRAIVRVWPSWSDGTGAAGVADALCKMHGPRGLGDAATYNTTINIWEVKNTIIHLGYDGNPDPTDVGRIWNEGLAFWGWLFYVSKFYEVLDTLIILAKGKRSATLQTYHHSGAMLCMWAGIRYMSPPIWMFVFVNSFIHGLMYTYFTLSALGVKVPTALKRSLTTLQIAQFLWGSTYAAAHLFIKYDIPVSTPYQVAAIVKAAASSVSSAATEASSTVSKIIESPAATGTMVALVKKLLLRAVGEEGIAERVTANDGSAGHHMLPPKVEQQIDDFNHRTQPQFETKWRSELTKVNCIDTSGEAFAIYLNLLYLAPLTFLFARFFIKAYTGRGRARTASQAAKQAKQSGNVAIERTEETVEGIGRKGEDIIEKEAQRTKLSATEVHEQLRKDVQAMKNGTWGRDRRVSDHVQDFENQVRSAADKAKEQAKALGKTGSPRRPSPSKRSLEVPGTESSQNSNSSAIVDTQSPTLEKPKTSPLEEPVKSLHASGEPATKQEDNLAATEATRPGATVESSEADISSGLDKAMSDSEAKLSTTNAQDDDRTYSEVVQDGTTTESITSSFTSSSGQQGPSMTESTFTDTDAMGKSGVDVEYTTESGETVGYSTGDRDFSEMGGERDFPIKSTPVEDDKPNFRPPGSASS